MLEGGVKILRVGDAPQTCAKMAEIACFKHRTWVQSGPGHLFESIAIFVLGLISIVMSKWPDFLIYLLACAENNFVGKTVLFADVYLKCNGWSQALWHGCRMQGRAVNKFQNQI